MEPRFPAVAKVKSAWNTANFITLVAQSPYCKKGLGFRV